MATHIHLIRHGEVANPDNLVYASLAGFGLSELGRIQAKEVSRYLGSAPIVAVWSSPLERALETAIPIARRFGLPISIEPELIEWRLLDRWIGSRWDTLDRDRPGELAAYLADPTQLGFADETLRELAVRITSAIKSIDERHPGGDVVIVGHQDPVQAGRLALTGRDLKSLHTDKPRHGSVLTLTSRDGWKELDHWFPDTE